MKFTRICCSLLVAAQVSLAAGRSGGNFDILYESINAGGAGYASNGAFKLGGTLGQAGQIAVRTGDVFRLSPDGFWKGETGCEMYPVAISNIVRATNNIAVSFSTYTGNSYSLAYLNIESNGLRNGVQVWTNIVAGPVTGQGNPVASTTLYVNISSVTNAGRFFLIQCQ